MRDDDDDLPGDSAGGPLAEGLGETVEPGDFPSTSDPYGDVGDSYGDTGDSDDDSSGEDTDGDEAGGDDAIDDDAVDDGSGDLPADEDPVPQPTDDTGTVSPDEGTFGDGEDDITVDDTGAADEADAGSNGEDDTTTGDGIEGTDLLAESGSPLEGIGYLLDELHGALFGDEDDLAAQDEAVVAAFDAEPADIETDTDLDLNGDGVVDQGDLHEAESPFDFGVDHAGG